MNASIGCRRLHFGHCFSRRTTLGEGVSGAAQELGDDLAGLLAALVGDPLQALGVVALDAYENRQLRVGIALVHLDLGVVKLGVEVAGLGIGVSPGVLGYLNLGFYARGRLRANR